MRKNLFLFFIFLGAPFYLKAQKIDTVWYNKQNSEVKNIGERDNYTTTTYNKDTKLYEVIAYRLNGKIYFVGSFSSLKPPVKNGIFTWYDQSGIITSKINYSRDVMIEFYQYKDGKQTDHLINENNPPTTYNNDKSAIYTSLTSLDLNGIPVKYLGGEAGLKLFIQEHLIYPKEASVKNIQGTVYVLIKIDEKGNAYDLSIQRPSDPLLNNEAIRTAKLIPNTWVAAKNADKQPIKSSIIIPIKFSL